MISQHNKQGSRNPWVIGIVAFLAVVVTVNGFMIWNGMNNVSGLVDSQYSVTKHKKNDALWVDQLNAREALGWQAKLRSPQQLANDPLAHASATRFVVMNSTALFQFGVRDKEGASINGATVTIQAIRPSYAAYSFSSSMQEMAPGIYEGSLNFPLQGNWELAIQTKRGQDEFDVTQKIFVAFAP